MRTVRITLHYVSVGEKVTASMRKTVITIISHFAEIPCHRLLINFSPCTEHKIDPNVFYLLDTFGIK